MKKYFRLILVIALVLGVLIAARGQTAWAGQNDNVANTVDLKQVGQAVLPAKPGPGSVKPPPSKFYACEDGTYSVGGVVILEIKDLKPGYCIEAVLWNSRFQIHRLPDGIGSPLAHMLFLRVYLNGRLVYDVPAGDGTIEACYAIPPGKQGQFYFYDFYGKRFDKSTELPRSWEPLDTRVDTESKTACAFTQVSGVYGLIGK